MPSQVFASYPLASSFSYSSLIFSTHSICYINLFSNFQGKYSSRESFSNVLGGIESDPEETKEGGEKSEKTWQPQWQQLEMKLANQETQSTAETVETSWNASSLRELPATLSRTPKFLECRVTELKAATWCACRFACTD